MVCNFIPTYDGLSYGLSKDQVNLWQNVESVMLATAKALGSGQLVSLEHQIPLPPSQYGYMRTYGQSKPAKVSLMKSLNAFQRLLAYCSYSLAGASSLDPVGEDCAQFYSDRWLSDLYNKLDLKEPDVHILAKLLLSTLWQIRTTRNFTGVVVNHAEEYDYLAVKRMLGHNVPVYVSWPDSSTNPYESFHQHHHLKRFRPTPEQFRALEPPTTPQPVMVPAPVAETPTIRHDVPPTNKHPETYGHPLEYVEMRLRLIETELQQSPNKQSLLSRLESARRFTSLGSAKYYRFECVSVIDVQTGQEKNRWTRVCLSKHDALEDFQFVKNRHLWYAHSVSFFLSSF